MGSDERTAAWRISSGKIDMSFPSIPSLKNWSKGDGQRVLTDADFDGDFPVGGGADEDLVARIETRARAAAPRSGSLVTNHRKV
jgi:hypothetical protein